MLLDPEAGHYRRLLAASGMNIASFAQGHDGEIYVLAYDGVIAKLISAGAAPGSFSGPVEPDRLRPGRRTQAACRLPDPL